MDLTFGRRGIIGKEGDAGAQEQNSLIPLCVRVHACVRASCDNTHSAPAAPALPSSVMITLDWLTVQYSCVLLQNTPYSCNWSDQ